MSPESIQKAPALIGDCKIAGNELLNKTLSIITEVLKIKQVF